MAEIAKGFQTKDFWTLAFTGRQHERPLSPLRVRSIGEGFIGPSTAISKIAVAAAIDTHPIGARTDF